MSELRVGVVGLGIGREHVQAWSEVDGAAVTAIAEVKATRRERATRDNDIHPTESLDELLEFGVDVVDLCTPPALHEEQIERCLTAGVHVICEKPLVDSVAACDRLRSMLSRQTDVAEGGAVLMPIMQYRFGDGMQRARALVDAGLTGRLYTASAATWWRRGQAYYDSAPWRGTWAGERGGSVLTHAIHVHDLLTHLGGPLAEVRAMTATRVNDIETEDCAVAAGRTADGALVTMNVNVGAATESSRLAWCFEHVTIESTTAPYDPSAGPWTFRFSDPDVEAEAERIWATLPEQPPLFAGQFQGFVDAVRTGVPLPVDLDDATRSLELVTAWYRSARTGSVETLPLAADDPGRSSWQP